MSIGLDEWVLARKNDPVIELGVASLYYLTGDDVPRTFEIKLTREESHTCRTFMGRNRVLSRRLWDRALAYDKRHGVFILLRMKKGE